MAMMIFMTMIDKVEKTFNKRIPSWKLLFDVVWGKI